LVAMHEGGTTENPVSVGMFSKIVQMVSRVPFVSAYFTLLMKTIESITYRHCQVSKTEFAGFASGLWQLNELFLLL